MVLRKKRGFQNVKLIKKITDRDILGLAGISTQQPRITARAILKNNRDMYAVMHSEKFSLYSLPGGGVEPDENIKDAIKREIWEETGCNIADIQELGCIEENRAHCDYTQIDYYYLVTTNDETLCPHMTDNELRNGTSVLWLNAQDMYQRIATPQHTTNQRKFLQARDVAALQEYFSQNNIII